MLTLKELVDRCLSKDKLAWNEFVLKFKPIVERAVRSRLSRHNFPHSIEDTKDITQGIFLDIWEENKLGQVKDEDKISGWLVIVAQNATIDFMRRSKNVWRQDLRAIDEEGRGSNLTEAIASTANPLKELANNELADTLQALIDGLNPRDRLILKLNLLHHQSHKEIATLLKTSINTVSTIIRRSLLKLRESLEKRGFKDF